MKLHLGCGKKHIPGWTHVDVVPLAHIDLCHPIDRLPMIQDNTVEVIYACHVLEHFMRKEIAGVLSEWHRVLKPGGVLRISVPNFNAIAKWYREGGDLNDVMGLLFGGQTYLYNFHYTVFDAKTLEEALITAGFVGLRLYDWRDTEHADMDDYSQAYLPHLDKETGLLMSLNVEAVKGPLE